jgi:hypothetical protein
MVVIELSTKVQPQVVETTSDHPHAKLNRAYRNQKVVEYESVIIRNAQPVNMSKVELEALFQKSQLFSFMVNWGAAEVFSVQGYVTKYNDYNPGNRIEISKA